MSRVRTRRRTPGSGILLVGVLAGCATFVPPHFGVVRAPGVEATLGAPPVPALALVGDIGIPSQEGRTLAVRMGERLRGSTRATVIVLGDVFYRDGLLGLCPEGPEAVRSLRGCDAPGAPESQLEAVLAPYRQGLAGHPLVALAGNHDHYGDPESTRNGCGMIPGFAPDWSYLAHGCGLDETRPTVTLDLGSLIVFLVDSERMIRDASFRATAARGLEQAVRRAMRERPGAWRVLAMHHPLESYGSHNGGGPLTALRKDLYWLTQSVLLPVSILLERTVLERPGHQDLYERRYRAFRRAVYRALREAPIDLAVAGHDHSLQLIRIDHPGVGHQVVSGAGAYPTPVKPHGLDLFFLNRLARGVGLGEVLPAPAHRLLFGAGPDAGLGYAVLAPDGDRLVVEIHSTRSTGPLLTYALRRE